MEEMSQEEIDKLIKKLTYFYSGEYNLFDEESLQSTLNSIVATMKKRRYLPIYNAVKVEKFAEFLESFIMDLDSKDDMSVFKYTNSILIKIVDIAFIYKRLIDETLVKVNADKELYKKVVKVILEHVYNTNNITLHTELLNNYSNIILLLYPKIKDNLLKNSQKINDFTMYSNLYSFFSYNFNYDESDIDALIAGIQVDGNYSFLTDFICKQSKLSVNKKAFKYLVSNGKIEEVSCVLNTLINILQENSKESKEMISFYVEKCINQNRVGEIINLWKLYFNEYTTQRVTIQSFSEIGKEKIFELLSKLNKDEKDIIDFLIVLWYEADTILQDYSHIDFSQYPETKQSLKSLDAKDGIQKFHKFILKVLKSGKPILALYILNNQGCYINKSDVKLWIDSYIEAFVLLDKVDLLAKHYRDFGTSINSIELLQRIAEYYIKEKDSQMALNILEKISLLEPTYPYIKSAKQEISRLSMIRQLSNSNIDIENINLLSGQEFEQLLINKFNELGYKITETPHTGDFGADIIVDTKSDTRFIIQCKRFKSKVNLKAVQEVVGALSHYNGDIGIVITNSGFLSSAIKLAESNEIELWDNLKLMKFLSGDLSFSQMKDL